MGHFGSKYDEDIPEGHAFQATRGCPVDELLRKRFQIESRPKNGPTLWRRKKDGAVVTQEQALKEMQDERGDVG